jgi:glycosyltransferase involved in cell wall biosynthesis
MGLVVAPTRGRLRKAYGRAAVALVPSIAEGFGLVAIEAMGSGAALVTTDNGGSRDYAVHEETALVCPAGDAEAMAAAVARLLTDDDLRRRIASAGRDRARQFSWDRSAETLEAHLRAYLSDPQRFLSPVGRLPD